MLKEQVTIISPSGIHARPAGDIVKAAGNYDCTITLAKGDKEIQAKRLISILGLGAKQGDEITITTDGPDEEAAMAEIKKVLLEAH
ncbi:MAG: hypothetical protein ATN34_01130 [Epulopiscium sp. Nele67-Bin002]|nr:MAG: hypothetical protein ATN34_01130 [Epulopiscium sp. Nele67-Bin002]